MTLPRMTQDQLPTPEQVAAAYAAWQADRAALDLPLDELPITLRPLEVLVLDASTLPLSQRVACAEALSGLVEQYGLDAVGRSLRLLEAAK